MCWCIQHVFDLLLCAPFLGLAVEWAPFVYLHIVSACICLFLYFPCLFSLHCLVSLSSKVVAPLQLSTADLLGPPTSIGTLQWHRKTTESTTTCHDDDHDYNWDDHDDDDECRHWNECRWSTTTTGDAAHSVSIAAAVLGPCQRAAEFPAWWMRLENYSYWLNAQRGPTTQ